MDPVQTAHALQDRFQHDIQEVLRFRGEVTALVSRGRLSEVARHCRDELGYNFLSDVSCTDWLGKSPRFDVVWQIAQVPATVRFRLKIQTDEGEPAPSLTSVWGAANWPEREVWDLFGVEFEGHPNLGRLLMPEGWVGFPLRKDYAQTQIALPRPRTEKVGE